MKILGIYNIKGGVGKTSSAVNFSYLCAGEGEKTLLIDLDPQGSSTYYFNIKQGIDASTKKIISGKAELIELVRQTEFKNLFIIPSDFSFRNMDVILDDVKKSKKRLSEILKPLKGSFDWIFLDCPPGISLLSENVFQASDYIILPTVPTPLSLRTYKFIIDFFNENDINTKNIIPFYSMVEQRKKIHRDILENTKDSIAGICENYIPYLSDIEKMGVNRKPVPFYRPNSKAALAYISLWGEIKKRLK